MQQKLYLILKLFQQSFLQSAGLFLIRRLLQVHLLMWLCARWDCLQVQKQSGARVRGGSLGGSPPAEFLQKRIEIMNTLKALFNLFYL